MGGNIEVEQVVLTDSGYVVILNAPGRGFEVIFKASNTTIKPQNGESRGVVCRSYLYKNGDGYRVDKERLTFLLLYCSPFKEFGLTPKQANELVRTVIGKIVEAREKLRNTS